MSNDLQVWEIGQRIDALRRYADSTKFHESREQLANEVIANCDKLTSLLSLLEKTES